MFYFFYQGLDTYFSFSFLLILLYGLPGRQTQLFGKFSFFSFFFFFFVDYHIGDGEGDLLGTMQEI